MAYESKARVTTIKASSKTTIKIRDNYYSVEYTEERTIPDVDGVDIEEEKRLLWDSANSTVDEQAADIVKTFRK